MEKTLIILKPDAVERKIMGQVIDRFERKGLCFLAMKMIRFDRELACEHYGEHRGKEFFEPLIQFITRSPVVVAVVGGESAVTIVRRLVGTTDSSKAAPGTIRGDYGTNTRENIVHASDSVETARKEIDLFFDPAEVFDDEVHAVLTNPAGNAHAGG